MSGSRNESIVPIWTDVDVDANPNSAAFRVRDVYRISLTVHLVSGTIAAASTFKFQVSNDGLNDDVPPTVWADLPSGSFVWSGAAGTAMAFNAEVPYKWMRVVFTDGAASATPVVKCIAKFARFEGIG